MTIQLPEPLLEKIQLMILDHKKKWGETVNTVEIPIPDSATPGDTAEVAGAEVQFHQGNHWKTFGHSSSMTHDFKKKAK